MNPLDHQGLDDTVDLDEAPRESSGSSLSGQLPQIIGYQLLGLIGQNGCCIYKARDENTNQLVMLKVVHSSGEFGERIWKGLCREAAILGRLHHPNILAQLRLGESNGIRFSALEYSEWRGLNHAIRDSRLSNAQALELLETVARAVHFGHSKGVVHGDLKPSNILVSTEEIPKIAGYDWSARLMDEPTEADLMGMIVGTLAYMSPEQAEGKRSALGPASDVYALGTILYQVLARRLPFERSREGMLRKFEQEPLALRTLVSSIPRQVDTLVMKCLQKEPRRRYASAVELADDLKRVQEVKSIVGRLGWLERITQRRWLRQRIT